MSKPIVLSFNGAGRFVGSRPVFPLDADHAGEPCVRGHRAVLVWRAGGPNSSTGADGYMLGIAPSGSRAKMNQDLKQTGGIKWARIEIFPIGRSV